MQTLVLEDVQTFRIREIPVPTVEENQVLIRVRAVGICGTDLHIFHGLANYNRNTRGEPVSLQEHPQVLGHEFCGRVDAVGTKVKKCKPGDYVTVDQVLTCWSQGRTPRCEYCEAGDSHQCEFQQEFGITGVPGAFADYISVPETNVIVIPSQIPFEKAAIIEPLACVLHASDRMEKARNRYTFDGRYRIRFVLIMGAGPSGLLFVQYLRKIKQFDGEIFVCDMRRDRLELARNWGGTPLDVGKVDLINEIQQRTGGERVHYLIESSGSGSVFDSIPAVIRRQATVLIYGSGHSGRDIGCMTPFQYRENVLVTTCGASGAFDEDGTPLIYHCSMNYILDGKIEPASHISHRYTDLVQLQQAFAEDSKQDNYIKGILVRT